MFGGSNSPQSSQPEAIKAIRIQSSSNGVVRPLVYGTNRVTVNLIYYNDFIAEPVSQSVSGGK